MLTAAMLEPRYRLSESRTPSLAVQGIELGLLHPSQEGFGRDLRGARSLFNVALGEERNHRVLHLSSEFCSVIGHPKPQLSVDKRAVPNTRRYTLEPPLRHRRPTLGCPHPRWDQRATFCTTGAPGARAAVPKVSCQSAAAVLPTSPPAPGTSPASRDFH